jgi:hypothetical protein
MPTLTPQTISGLVVVPTVENVGGVWRVSLGINVGASRAGSAPAQVVNREDLIVELFEPSVGTFEAIQSPDPGALPVRALRVVQARGEFTFGQQANPPTELRVRLHGQLGTFPLSGTFATAGRCFSSVPKEGAAFPIGKRPMISILQRFPWPRKARCKTKRVAVPENRQPDAAAKSESFDMFADFAGQPPRTRCSCCEYRQYVRGTFTNADGQSVRFDLPSGALDPGRYCEDGTIDEFGPGKHGYYGHRGAETPGDDYGGQGCMYKANEKVGCPPTDVLHAEFVGLVVDTCQRRVVAVRTWTVDL